MLFMNLKREGIRDFQLLMKWRNRSYGISRSLLWEVVVGRLSYDDIRRLTCRGTKNRYSTYPWKLTSWVLDHAGRRSAGGIERDPISTSFEEGPPGFSEMGGPGEWSQLGFQHRGSLSYLNQLWPPSGHQNSLSSGCSSHQSAAGGTWQAFMAWVPTGSSMQNPEPWSLATPAGMPRV